MAWRLGLLGASLGHSLSPVIHRAALDACGEAGDYTLYEVDEAGVAAAVERLRAGALDGLNVTIPHKVTAAARVDALVGAAAALGAVNTLVRAPGGRVLGHNTDVTGLAQAARDAFGVADLGGCAVAVVGAGGAARAAVLAAFALGAAEVRVSNRTPTRAEALVAELRARGVAGRLSAVEDARTAARDAALLFQASSQGMSLAPGTPPWQEVVDAARPVVDALRADGAVLDLVYRPAATPWCAAAAASGRRAAHGLAMLVHQAADAFALWTGHAPPRERLMAAAQAALDAREG